MRNTSSLQLSPSDASVLQCFTVRREAARWLLVPHNRADADDRAVPVTGAADGRDALATDCILYEGDVTAWTSPAAVRAHDAVTAVVALAVASLLPVRRSAFRMVREHDVSFLDAVLTLGIARHTVFACLETRVRCLQSARLGSATASLPELSARPLRMPAEANEVAGERAGSTAIRIQLARVTRPPAAPERSAADRVR